MISFIIIGRNESFHLKKCLQSVFRAIELNKIENFEIIYIDSNSSDNSIQLAQGFPSVRIYELTSDFNAAIARNLGAEISQGETLFFIDGDLEINAVFLKNVMDEKTQLNYEVVIGNSMHYYYNISGAFLFSKTEKPNMKNLTVRGWFLITKNVWNTVGGMNSNMRLGQDRDFFLKLIKRRIDISIIDEVIATHHTVSYLNTKRMWRRLFNGDELYARSLFYRRHAFNKHIWRTVIKQEYTLLAMIAIVIAGCLLNFYLIFLVYPALVIGRILIQKNKNIMDIVQRIPYYVLRDLLVVLGFVFFYPSNKKNIKFKIVE